MSWQTLKMSALFSCKGENLIFINLINTLNFQESLSKLLQHPSFLINLTFLPFNGHILVIECSTCEDHRKLVTPCWWKHPLWFATAPEMTSGRETNKAIRKCSPNWESKINLDGYKTKKFCYYHISDKKWCLANAKKVKSFGHVIRVKLWLALKQL